MTYIHGTLGEFSCKQKVKVEIPSQPILEMPVLSTPSWSVKSTSNLKNIELLPDGIEYDYSAGRSPFIELMNDFCLYSLPTSVRIILNPGKAGLNLLILRMNLLIFRKMKIVKL